MAQRYVEVVLGRLVTDEEFRHRFRAAPRSLLDELQQEGVELTAVEREALLRVDATACDRFADGLDRRLQKARLR